MMSESGKKPTGLGKRAGKRYLSARAHTATRLDLIIMSHEGAIRAAHQEDAVQLKRILEMLISGLDFSKIPEFAIGQFRIYKDCQRAADEGRFDEVIHLLTQMKDAWELLKQSGQADGLR